MATNSELSNLTTGLISFWNFNGNSNDAVGNYHGTDTSISYVPGKIGNCATFVSGSSIATSLIPPSGDSDRTYSVWIKDFTIPPVINIICGNGIDVNGQLFKLAVLSDGTLGVWGGGTNIFSLTIPDNSVWTHLVATYSSGVYRIYINGVLDNTANVGSLNTFANSFSVGGFSFVYGTYFEGKTDALGVWSRALSASEVSILYNNGSGLSFPFVNRIVPRRILRHNNTSLSNGLLSYWKLDGDSSDSLSNGTNSGSGGTFVNEGKIGQGNKDSIVTITSTSALNLHPNGYSVSLWMKFSDAVTAVVINKLGSGGNIEHGIYKQTNYVQFFTNGGTGFVQGPATMSADTWYHLTYTTNGSTLKGYINGVLVGTSNYSFVVSSTSDPIYIGGDFGAVFNRTLSGSTDEFAFWNRELTADEIFYLYNNGDGTKTVLKNNLVAYWGFEGNVSDSSGSNGLDYDINYVVGKNNQGASFNGLSSQIVTSNTTILNGATQASFSFWFNLSAQTVVGNTHTLINKWYYTDGTRACFQLETTTSELFMFIADSSGDSGSNYFLTNGVNWSYGTWKHIVIVYDGTQSGNVNKIKIYADGVLLDSSLFSFAGTIPANLTTINQPITLGLFPSNTPAVNRWLNGKMDEVGIWNRVLTQSEVLDIYNNGFGNQYPFPRQLSKNLPVLNSTLESGVAAYYKLDGNSNDSMGLNNGTDAVVTYVSAKIGEGASFNGVSSDITLNDTLSSAQGTISFWINPNSLATQSRPFYRENLFLYLFAGVDLLCISINGGSVINTNISLTAGTWNHIVITYDGTDLKVYNNAVLAFTWAYTAPLGSAANMHIGGVGGSEVFNGKIDEFGVWNRVLTSSEIVRLYNYGNGLQYPFRESMVKVLDSSQNIENGLLNYWTFDENSNDVAGLNNGTDSSVTYTAAKISQGVYFNGTISSKIDVSTIALSGDYSVAFWIKLPPENGNWGAILTPNIGATGSIVAYNYAPYTGSIAVSGNIATAGTPAGVVSANTFTHVTITRSGTTSNIYVNGIYQASGSLSGTITYDTFSYLNQYGVALNCTLDEFGIWNRCLSQSEIATLYNNNNGIQFPFFRNRETLFDDLISYHKLDGNSNDALRINNGTDSSITYTSGKKNQAADNGGTGSIRIPFNSNMNTSALTISLWLNKTANIGNEYIFSKLNDNVGLDNDYAIGANYFSQEIIFYMRSMTMNADAVSTAISGITLGTWQHIVYTYDGSIVRGYLDGELVVNSKIDKVMPQGSGDTYLFSYQGSSNFTNAKLDEIGVWRRALTLSEISTLYNNGNGLSYELGKVLTTKRLLLDNYPGALAGYSLRKLRDRYNGACVRIRRSSDNTEQDFGFVNDYFDTSSFSTFVGSAGTGYITTWYDQTENGLDVTQTGTTYQPYIQLNILNGKAVVRFVQNSASSFLGNNDPMVQEQLSGVLKDSSLFITYRETENILYNSPFILNHPPNNYFSYNQVWVGDGQKYFTERTDSLSSTTPSYIHDVSRWTVVSSLYNSYIEAYMNGASVLTPVARANSQLTISQINVGGGSASLCLDGQMLECVLYASNKTVVRAEIESNINDYYGLY